MADQNSHRNSASDDAESTAPDYLDADEAAAYDEYCAHIDDPAELKRIGEMALDEEDYALSAATMARREELRGESDENDVDSIVPARAIQQAADDHDVSPDALRAALQQDLERNQRMADRIIDRRPVVHETDDYAVVRASDGVTDETPLPVLSVYRWMDDSDTDYTAGYPLVVPTFDEETDLDGFESAAEKAGDDND